MIAGIADWVRERGAETLAWYLAHAEELRAWLIERAPDSLDWIIRLLPAWALPIFAVVAIGALLQQAFAWLDAAIVGYKRLAEAIIKAIELARPRERQSDAEQQRIDAAAAREIARYNRRAAKLIARGKFDEGYALLRRAAERESARARSAAERWRALGALARGVRDGEALHAYEQAFKLAPDDFWACVELARLYRFWKGDVAAARQAAEAASRAARNERERTIADSELGDVLVLAGDLAGAKARFEASNAILEKLAAQNPGSAQAQRDVSVSQEKLGDVLVLAGDLAGAKARFEASLGVSEKLAAQNPGSAEAQRDLIVSYAKLGGMFPGQGWWAKGFAVCERLAAEGRLAPADAGMLDVLRAKAAADQ